MWSNALYWEIHWQMVDLGCTKYYQLFYPQSSVQRTMIRDLIVLLGLGYIHVYEHLVFIVYIVI